jgi:hypothetical protein
MRHLKILIGLMLIASTALAGNNVEIRFNYPDNVIYIGVENTVEVWIENDDSIHAMSLGLEFSGYDGVVNWNESYGNRPPFNEEGDAVGSFGGTMVSNTDNFSDSDLPDSIVFGGICVQCVWIISFSRRPENGCFTRFMTVRLRPIFMAAPMWEHIIPVALGNAFR